MKKTFLLIVCGLISITLYAQETVDDQIKVLYDNDQYKEIIEKHVLKDVEYSSQSLHCIGVAYLQTDDEENGIKYLDLSIMKDAGNPAPLYTKGIVHLYSDNFDEAVTCLTKAMELENAPEKLIKIYDALAETYYYQNKPDLAFDTCNKMLILDASLPTPYIMIGQIYIDMGQPQKALETYYNGKENASPDDVNFQTILYNIALLQHMDENYEQAEQAYNELLTINPEDYHVYAKLIQIHYHNKEYEKAEPLKKIIYQAHKENKLEEHMEDMFCIDQFKWNDKLIQVFERYQEGDSDKIYNKLQFYIKDNDGNVIYRIQTEYSPIAVAFGEGKYILCANKNGSHLNYGIGFTDESGYDSIKNTVIRIMEKDEDLK